MEDQNRTIQWDQHYQRGELPWDSGIPSRELTALFEHGFPGAQPDWRPASAIDIGCGTGTNVIWLARQGIDALGVDISATAVRMAQRKMAQADDASAQKARFLAMDILEQSPVPPGSIQFAFDRGCFHAIPADMRQRFVERIWQILQDSGYWLTLCGNADEDRQGRPGPPQLRAVEIVNAVEQRFMIQWLRPFRFNPDQPSPPLAWSCLLRRRPDAPAVIPAGSSSAAGLDPAPSS